MFQSTDSSNDEIYGFDGETHANGKGSESFQNQNINFFCIDYVEITLSHLKCIAWGYHTHQNYALFLS